MKLLEDYSQKYEDNYEGGLIQQVNRSDVNLPGRDIIKGIGAVELLSAVAGCLGVEYTPGDLYIGRGKQKDATATNIKDALNEHYESFITTNSG